MKKWTLLLLVTVASSLLLFSCKGNKDSSNKKDDTGNIVADGCDTHAIVMDYTGLSSCKYLLKLDDGSFLNPDSGVDRELLSKTMEVKMGYEGLPDMATTCMKGKLVKVTCFTVTKAGTPVKGKFE